MTPPTATTEPTEAAFMTTVVEVARLRGWLVYHTHDSRSSAAGFPDLVMLRDDRMLVVELKTKTGKVSPSQHVWLDAFTAFEGGLADVGALGVHVWRPADWEAIEAELK